MAESTKRLYIVRHAKSSWDDPYLSDDKRPLNKRGKRDAPIMAKYIADKIGRPEVFISSHAVRAYKTAVEFAAAFGITESSIKVESHLYHASSHAWMRVTESIDKGIQSAMLFGHNPGLTDFVNALTNSDIYNIPTTGVAGIDLNISSWDEIDYGIGSLAFYHYPKGI